MRSREMTVACCRLLPLSMTPCGQSVDAWVLLTASEGRTSDANYSSGSSDNRLESTCATRRPVRHIHPHTFGGSKSHPAHC